MKTLVGRRRNRPEELRPRRAGRHGARSAPARRRRRCCVGSAAGRGRTSMPGTRRARRSSPRIVAARGPEEGRRRVPPEGHLRRARRSTPRGSRSFVAGETQVFEKTTGKDKDGKDEEKWRQTAPAAKDADCGQGRRAAVGAHQRPRRHRSSHRCPPGAKPEAGVDAEVRRRPQAGARDLLRSGGEAFASREGSAGAAKIQRGRPRRHPQGARRREVNQEQHPAP